MYISQFAAPVLLAVANEVYKTAKAAQPDDLYMITVPLEPGDVSEEALYYAAILRYPSKDQLRIITPLLTKGDLLGATDMVLANCMVEGPKDMLEAAWFVMACIQPVEQMLLGRTGRLQKK